MGVEVVLNIGLGSYNHTVQSAMPGLQEILPQTRQFRLQVRSQWVEHSEEQAHFSQS